jgi:hypothetical protein
MKFPVETKPVLWGIAGGAAALAIVGFSWGGWVTGAKAEIAASQRANEAVVAALAPLCVEKFKRDAGFTVNQVELKKVDSWSQNTFVEKGGWATLGGSQSPDQVSAVARACALLLNAA